MKNQNEKLKLLIIGLDGATFDVILPMIKENKLPNLKRIMKTGIFGELQSTYPPITGPAWASFMTGRNPGKFGIYGFIDYDPKDYYGFVKGKLATSNSFSGSTFIDLLSSSGNKIGVISLPMTYPPWIINGVIVSGYPSPSTDRVYYYSSDPTIEIKESLEYSREQYRSEKRKMSEGFFIEKKRTEVALDLVKKMRLNCLILVNGDTDRIQHFFGVSPSNPIVAEHYQTADTLIGKLMDLTDENTRIFILSDHGTEPCPEVTFNTNSWLKKQGLLALNEKKAKAFTFFRDFYYYYTSFVERISRRLSSLLEIGNRVKETLSKSTGLQVQGINWRKTKVFRYPMPCTRIEGIVINVKDRQEYGIVQKGEEYEKLRDEIIGKLKNLRDPEKGSKVVKECFKREEIYNGRYVEKAPDIILYLGKHYIAADGISDVFAKVSSTEQKIVHSIRGILIANGPMVSRNKRINKAEIIDLAPTILYSMGVSIPKGMDGKILHEIFTDEFKLKPPKYFDEGTTERKPDYKLTEKEQREVEERLRALGYV